MKYYELRISERHFQLKQKKNIFEYVAGTSITKWADCKKILILIFKFKIEITTNFISRTRPH